jgi:hypothetical protein
MCGSAFGGLAASAAQAPVASRAAPASSVNGRAFFMGDSFFVKFFSRQRGALPMIAVDQGR